VRRDGVRLTNELIQPLLTNDPVAFGIRIDAVICARGEAVQPHAKAYRLAAVGTEHEV
jgi:hypothetical protein